MNDYILPFVRMVEASGALDQATQIVPRRLSDLRGFFADHEAEAALAPSDPLIYEVHYGSAFPEVEGQLNFCTTIIYPGKVGDEYFMTKGHYHARLDRAEIYFGLSGSGLLICQTPEGEVNTQPMVAGSAAYVPPYWGHRTANIGQDNFVFLSVFPADAGYDYKTIAENGFAAIVVERDGKTSVVANPNYHRA